MNQEKDGDESDTSRSRSTPLVNSDLGPSGDEPRSKSKTPMAHDPPLGLLWNALGSIGRGRGRGSGWQSIVIDNGHESST